MIKVAVKLENKTDWLEDVIEITKEELEQYACNRARDKWYNFNFNRITAKEIKINPANSLQIDK